MIKNCEPPVLDAEVLPIESEKGWCVRLFVSSGMVHDVALQVVLFDED